MKCKVAIVSDCHGLIRTGLKDELKDADWILHAGDFETQGCLNYFKSFDAKFFAVRGNVDYGSWANTLPKTQMITIGVNSIYMVHNLQDLDIDPLAANCQFIIFGHTHKADQYIRKGVHYINPGSVGPERRDCSTSMAILQFSDPDNSSSHTLDFVDLDA